MVRNLAPIPIYSHTQSQQVLFTVVFFLCILYECFLMYLVYTVCMQWYRVQKRPLDHLELELQMVVGHYLSAMNQAHIFCS